MNYYNEWDKGAAAWLRELIKAKLIPDGVVDERSITEVTPADLAGFTQCHFFAGVAGWPLALQLAGVPSTQPLWTGSPPCQPFSLAGKQLAQDDPRHLAPAFLELIAQCRPQLLFGEQVAAAIGKHWLDALFIELEEQDYTCGAAVLPACSVGAPHKRDRLFFGAVADGSGLGCQYETIARNAKQHASSGAQPVGVSGGGVLQLADTNDARPQGRVGMPERGIKLTAGSCGVASELADANGRESGNGEVQCSGQHGQQPEDGGAVREALRGQRCGDKAGPTNQNNGFWSGADWLGCRDGKFRPVEPSTFPLDNGISARVGRLRGYGNAIVPQVAAEFIKAFMISTNC